MTPFVGALLDGSALIVDKYELLVLAEEDVFSCAGIA